MISAIEGEALFMVDSEPNPFSATYLRHQDFQRLVTSIKSFSALPATRSVRHNRLATRYT